MAMRETCTIKTTKLASSTKWVAGKLTIEVAIFLGNGERIAMTGKFVIGTFERLQDKCAKHTGIEW